MMPLVGMLFRGYCGGAFGRDGWGEKRVESFGADWIVVRNDRGRPRFASFADTNEMLTKTAEWVQEPAE